MLPCCSQYYIPEGAKCIRYRVRLEPYIVVMYFQWGVVGRVHAKVVLCCKRTPDDDALYCSSRDFVLCTMYSLFKEL